MRRLLGIVAIALVSCGVFPADTQAQELDCSLVDNGSAPWHVWADGEEVRAFAKQGKAISYAVVHRILTGQFTSISYDGGRIEGEDCAGLVAPPDTIQPPPEDSVPEVPEEPTAENSVRITDTQADAVTLEISYAPTTGTDTEHVLYVEGAEVALVNRPAPNPAEASVPRGSEAQTVTIRARGFPSLEDWAVGSVTIPGTGTVEPPPPPPPGPEPPPPSGQHFAGDFSSFTDDQALHAFAGTTTTGNVHADPGVGMRYDFQAFPDRCGDQALSSVVGLPSGTKEVWMRFRIRFSGNWTTENPNCSSPAPGYKTVLTWLDASPDQGISRFDFKHRPDRIDGTAPGFPSADDVPFSVVTGGGSARDLLWGGEWRTVEIHQAVIGDDEALVQIRIDGTVTHNYRSRTTTGLSQRWIRRINIGANRNLGATSLMHVWFDDFDVWVGSNDPGFSFPPPTVYP